MAVFRDDRNCRENLSYLWNRKVPKKLMVAPDLFLRLQIHNRQGITDAGALKHFKPPATHWKKLGMALIPHKLLHAWIYYSAQRALVSTVAVLPTMNLKKINIQHAQKIIYNLLIVNMDFMILKNHNDTDDHSLLGPLFKAQLAQCTDLKKINELIIQELINML